HMNSGDYRNCEITGESGISAFYNPIRVLHHTDGSYHTTVNPIYYGLLAFSQFAATGTRLTTTTNTSNGTDRIRVWAVKFPNGHRYVFLMNTDPGNTY